MLDSAKERKFFEKCQTVEGWQGTPRDPVLRSYHMMAEAMVNCFVQDVKRYRRLKQRQANRQLPATRNRVSNEQYVELEFRSWLAWTRRKDDYFLSFKNCCYEIGVEPDVVLNQLDLSMEQ
jgi:hypothetical protein